MTVVLKVKHLVSPFDCTGKRVPPSERGWTWCGRLLYHVTPRTMRAPVCKVCERARAAVAPAEGKGET